MMLFKEDFKPSTKKEWLQRIEKELRGNPVELILEQKTSSGFLIEPYYVAEEMEALSYLQHFEHQDRKRLNRTIGWINRSYVHVKEEKAANKEILHLLETGADGIVLFLEEPRANFDALFENVLIEHCELIFEVNSIESAQQLMDNLAGHYEKNEGFSALAGSLSFHQDLSWYLSKTNELISFYRSNSSIALRFRNFRMVNIPGQLFHNCGFPPTAEVAHILYFLSQIIYGLKNDDDNAEITPFLFEISTAVGSKYFDEIAKIKAIRMLGYQIFSALGFTIQPSDIFISADSSDWFSTIQDSYNNLLRRTASAMAAITGGANAIHIKPFDSSFRNPSEFSKRISRNISTLLRAESHFDKVSDPVAGSYYLLKLIDETAKAAWSEFQLLHARDHYAEEEILELAANYQSRFFQELDNQKEIIIGLNKFQNAQDEIKPDEANNQLKITSPSAEYLKRKER